MENTNEKKTYILKDFLNGEIKGRVSCYTYNGAVEFFSIMFPIINRATYIIEE